VSFQLELSPPEAAPWLPCRGADPAGARPLRVPPGFVERPMLRLAWRRAWRVGSSGVTSLVEVRIMVPEQLNEAEESPLRRLEGSSQCRTAGRNWGARSI